jgi:hypothetical protein
VFARVVAFERTFLLAATLEKSSAALSPPNFGFPD